MVQVYQCQISYLNKMNIFNISSSYNFLEKIVDFTKSITSEELSLSKMTILLPSRRSCNELKRLFLEKSDGAIILPKIIAIGDIDYDDLLLKSIQINDLKNFTEISANTSRIKYKILLIKELIFLLKILKFKRMIKTAWIKFVLRETEL